MQSLTYAPVVSIIDWRFQEPDWASVVTFSAAPNSDVDDSLNGSYLGPFKGDVCRYVCLSKKSIFNPDEVRDVWLVSLTWLLQIYAKGSNEGIKPDKKCKIKKEKHN